MTFYKDVTGCDATDTTTYRTFEGDVHALDVCQGIAGAPTDDTISCLQYTDGGLAPPTSCVDLGANNFYGHSVRANTATTANGATIPVVCTLYASVACKDTSAFGGGGEGTCESYTPGESEGFVSFKCVCSFPM